MPRILTTSRVVSTDRLLIRTMAGSINFNASVANRAVTVPGYVPSSTTFSFGLWYKILEISSSQRIVSYRQTSGNLGGFELLQNGSNDRLVIFGYDNAGSITLNISPTTRRIRRGQWQHVVLASSPTATRMFMDGILVGSTVTGVGVMPIDQVLTLGRASAATTSPFNGNLAQFAYENGRMWSDSDARTLYEQGIIPATSSVTLQLNDGSGTTAADTSGNARNGAVVGGTGAVFITDSPLRSRTPVTGRTLIT